jgi:microcystin-dependent protein
MSTPYMGEIKIASFNFSPKTWALCNGQFLPINQNQALFSILGTTYGGNGQTTFALPNLQARIPIHVGNGFNLGEQGGETSHTLTTQEMPTHNHPALAQSTPSLPGTSPVTALWAAGAASAYANASVSPMNPAAVTSVGGSQPHANEAPYLVLNFVIALQGIFPSRN